MHDERPLPSSVIVSALTCAATTGALVAMGHRLGSVGIPFASISTTLSRRTVSGSAVGLVLTGLVLHQLVIIVWSAMALWIVRALHRSIAAAATIVAVLAFAISWVTARFTGSGVASVLPLGDRIVFAVIFAGALMVGMRFAFSARRGA